MATGLKIPVGVNRSGGAAIETDSRAELRKLLVLALSEGGDDNPFQNLGLSPNLVFQIKDAAFRSQAQREIERVIAQFPERVALLPDEGITFEEEVEGEVTVNFKYIDLEFNTVEEFTKTFTR